MPALAGAAAAQHAAAVRLVQRVEGAYGEAVERVRREIAQGAPLAGAALTHWHGLPHDSTPDELLALSPLPGHPLRRCGTAAADERVAEAGRQDPVARPGRSCDTPGAAERTAWPYGTGGAAAGQAAERAWLRDAEWWSGTPWGRVRWEEGPRFGRLPGLAEPPEPRSGWRSRARGRARWRWRR
ncbi:hypothetical protein SANTM175S_03283 [Streptomyces antimycoticus]